ncbi:MAG: hypothetical protein VB070_07880 [Clostridiaceae bacterium]|nr:hypothetical protein [Clostridiaceae bacterium]
MNKPFQVISPMDGDMLNERDGRLEDGCLLTEIQIQAPAGSAITVNQVPAVGMNGRYTAAIRLRSYRNVLQISDTASGYTEKIVIYWLRHFTGRYRVSMDDNIWFLQDIAENAGHYHSIFDNPYLGFFRQVHEQYGTKVHVNIYYQTDGFNLTQMPDRYKAEWRAHADWLRLSFHALQNEPDNPYAESSYDEMKRDYVKVADQIERFAGIEVLGPVTTLHWGAATVEGCRALRDQGILCQVGDFNVDNDLPPVSYYLDVEKRRNIYRRSVWKDNAEDIIFFRSSIITDCHKLDRITPFLDEIGQDPHRSGYMDFLIHEQYFYPFYCNYQPDYRDKVLTVARWAAERNYQPAFLSDCVLR